MSSYPDEVHLSMEYNRKSLSYPPECQLTVNNKSKKKQIDTTCMGDLKTLFTLESQFMFEASPFGSVPLINDANDNPQPSDVSEIQIISKKSCSSDSIKHKIIQSRSNRCESVSEPVQMLIFVHILGIPKGTKLNNKSEQEGGYQWVYCSPYTGRMETDILDIGSTDRY